ncbi:MAG: YceI family protein [Gammaproteobacteria bacterium]|nr:YceI family protein [Gammaproteobacteria bacterium]
MKLRNTVVATALVLVAGFSSVAQAAEYKIDTKDTHSFIQFKIQHLGYSWLLGRFNKFEGDFSYDQNNEAASKISVTIDTASVDSNHERRDKHLRSDDFLDVDKFEQASFVSTSYKPGTEGKGKLMGQFTLHGVTKSITIDVNKIGEGQDPWGGYRAGFEGSTTLKLTDYNIMKNLGPKSQEVELYFSFEGIQQK